MSSSLSSVPPMPTDPMSTAVVLHPSASIMRNLPADNDRAFADTNRKFVILLYVKCSLGVAAICIAIATLFGASLLGIILAAAAGAVAGACIIPLIGRIMQSKTSIKQKQMSQEDALKILNVPLERARDLPFIEAQYKLSIARTTPKRPFGPSPMLTMTNQMLAGIHLAYKTVTAQ